MVKAAATKKTDLDEATGGNIGQIREIIFGEQIRDYEKRFKALEKRITKAADELTKRLEERVSDMENSLERQAELLRKDLRAESDSGSAALQAAEKRIDQALAKVNATLGELDEFATKETHNLGNQLESQVTELRALLDSVADEARSQTEQQAQALRQDSVDRKALGELLHRLADEIGG